MAEGSYYAGGMERFVREGSSLQENSADANVPPASFNEQLQKMEKSGDADRIAERYEFGVAVAKLLETTPLEKLSPAVCEDFLFKSDKFSEYHPATVLAVARAIVKRQQATQAKLH